MLDYKKPLVNENLSNEIRQQGEHSKQKLREMKTQSRKNEKFSLTISHFSKIKIQSRKIPKKIREIKTQCVKRHIFT